jgi:hypothetical protein
VTISLKPPVHLDRGSQEGLCNNLKESTPADTFRFPFETTSIIWIIEGFLTEVKVISVEQAAQMV